MQKIQKRYKSCEQVGPDCNLGPGNAMYSHYLPVHLDISPVFDLTAAMTFF